MAKKKFKPITRKVNGIIIISLVLGIGIIITGYFIIFLTSYNAKIEENLTQQSDILYKAIEQFMIPGYAPLAVNFFNDVNQINPDYTIGLFRTDGQKAFLDNTTIETVNSNLEQNQLSIPNFEQKTVEIEDKEKPVEEYFTPAVIMPPQTVFFQTQEDNKYFFRIYKPLINLPRCTVCHGSDHTIRGVIDIRNDITDDVNIQMFSLGGGVIIFIIIVAVLAFILALFLRNSVIIPVKSIGNVCTSVTNGDFEKKVNINNKDEIGILGDTVNTMVEGLHERFKLSKFVSSSTLKSLKAEERGQKIPLTIFFSDIRGFTSYAEQKMPEDVVASLNKILNFQTEVIHEYKGDIDKYVGDEIVAIYSETDPELSACAAALKIQNELTRKSEESYSGLKVGIGINYGEVILGMIGSEKRADYTIIGDNVNTASRLCNAARAGQIIISDSTYKRIKEKVDVKGPFKVKVKGKQEYLKVYILKGLMGDTV
jgi:adenylate cyclase